MQKMHKLQISDYNVKMKVRSEDGSVSDKEFPFKVLDSISMIIFHPELKLSGKELLASGKLAEKLEDEKNHKKEGESVFILLTAQEFGMVKRAFETAKGFGRNEIELIRRIEECEEVEVAVEEKKTK